MTKDIDRAVRTALKYMFLPIELIGYVISKTSLFAIGVIFVATIVVAAPPLKESIASSLFNVQCLTNPTKEIGKEYCDFVSIIFQILIALAVGGIFITEQIRERTEKALQAYQEQRGLMLNDQQRQIIDELYDSYIKAKSFTSGLSFRNLIGRTVQLYRDIRVASDIIAFKAPMHYMYMTSFRILSEFPRGFYGVLVLILIEGFLSTQVVKSYFEYLPVCEVIPTAPL